MFHAVSIGNLKELIDILITAVHSSPTAVLFGHEQCDQQKQQEHEGVQHLETKEESWD